MTEYIRICYHSGLRSCYQQAGTPALPEERISVRGRHGMTPRLLMCVLILLAFDVAHSNAQTLYRVSIEQGVKVKMRDGVSLAADIYRPVSDEKFPVLLNRTPYNRVDEMAMANELASHGYLVVMQDTRCRYES